MPYLIDGHNLIPKSGIRLEAVDDELELIAALQDFARREPGARIVYDVRASRAVVDRVRAADGVPLVNRVGHAFIKKRMRDENAVFGGEVSGHFYFRGNWYVDNGMIPALLVLEKLGREGRRLGEILAPLRGRYHISGEINSRVTDVERAVARIEERYRDGRIKEFQFPIRTTPWGSIMPPSGYEAPDLSSLGSPLLAHEPAALKVAQLPSLPRLEKELP